MNVGVKGLKDILEFNGFVLENMISTKVPDLEGSTPPLRCEVPGPVRVIACHSGLLSCLDVPTYPTKLSDLR